MLGMQPRHLQNMSIEAFYDLYVLWCKGNDYEDAEISKVRTFSYVFEEKWKHLLKFREISQHARSLDFKQVHNNANYLVKSSQQVIVAVQYCCRNGSVLSFRCTQCSEFSARMRKVTMECERGRLEKTQSEHVRNVRMYRQTQSRLNALSEQAVSGLGSDTSILKLDLDGLDQAKTRYPRMNTINSKSLAGAWRPQIHLLGCIVWGVPLIWVKDFLLFIPGVGWSVEG